MRLKVSKKKFDHPKSSLTQIGNGVEESHIGATDWGVRDAGMVGHLADEHGVLEDGVEHELAENQHVKRIGEDE